MPQLRSGEHPFSQTTFQVGNAVVNIDTYHCRFNKWQKPVSFDTYGGKTVLDLNGEPLFAELYVLRLLEAQGFSGVWVDTYRNKFWVGLPSYSEPIKELPLILQTTYNSIVQQNATSRKGCWDVIAHRNNDIIFVELKRVKRDSIRQSQVDWLKAAIEVGLSASNFAIVEWDTME